MASVFQRFLGVIDNLTEIKSSLAGREHVLIRPFNQAILMYPIAILGLWGYLLVGWLDVGEATFGRIYLWTLFINFLVLFFDLRFGKAVIILSLAVIAGFILNTVGMLGDVLGFLGNLNPEMNATFYFLISIVWAIVFSFVWADRRSFVIVVEPNHLAIHDKWIGEAQQYPIDQITLGKEIGDALELLLGFGTIKINNANSGHLIRAVPHVFRVTHVLEEIKRVTAELEVEVNKGTKAPS